MIFYQEWIQQGKVPPDQTPSVPVNAQSNCPVKVELDDGDVRGQCPASAVGLQAERTPIDSTGSNQEDRKDEVSPIEPVSEPTVRVVRADTVMPESNRDGRPDKDNAARYICDEAIYNDVQVDRDLQVSHNGVSVTSKGYNDVRTLKFEYREPPLPLTRKFYVEELRVELVRHLQQSSTMLAFDGVTQTKSVPVRTKSQVRTKYRDFSMKQPCIAGRFELSNVVDARGERQNWVT